MHFSLATGQYPPHLSPAATPSPRRGRTFGCRSIFQRKREKCVPNSNAGGMEGPQALHHKSAGRALPARGEFKVAKSEIWQSRRRRDAKIQIEDLYNCASRREARDPESKIHSSRILRPKISAEILAKSANPKTPWEFHSHGVFDPIRRNRKIYLKRITHCTRVRATRAPS